MTFQDQLTNLYAQIKKMKLKNCITLDKQNGSEQTAKIIKKSMTKRTFGENEIVFKMDDYMSWSIHELNFNEITITDNSIVLFETNDMKVTFAN
ncbi:hypothetical protein V7128_02040 [Neobacillus vireti]|uniref:hypothetical protein n=1 Tax=Neobacillus vireti TaxID=220686 RepID=UPI002FFF1BBA